MNLRHFRRKGGVSVISLPPGPLADIYSQSSEMEELDYNPDEEQHTPPAGKGRNDESK